MNDQTNYVNPNRFFGSTNKSAAELQDEYDTLKNNGIPSRYNVVSMYDMFGDDESKHAPHSYNLSSVEADGKTFSFNALVRGISNKIGGEHSNSADFMELAEYFAFLAKSLNSAVDSADLNKAQNDSARENNIALANAKAALEAQVRHESLLSDADWNNIKRDEETQNTLNTLRTENASLKSEQSLIAKALAALTPKKKSVAKKTTK